MKTKAPHVVKCVCGKYPKITEETNYTGGGRYKGMTKTVSWEAVCPGCDQRAYQSYGIFKTRIAVIAAWNEAVAEDIAERDAPDKMLYALERGDLKEGALARILKELAELKQQIARRMGER